MLMRSKLFSFSRPTGKWYRLKFKNNYVGLAPNNGWWKLSYELLTILHRSVFVLFKSLIIHHWVPQSSIGLECKIINNSPILMNDWSSARAIVDLLKTEWSFMTARILYILSHSTRGPPTQQPRNWIIFNGRYLSVDMIGYRSNVHSAPR